MKKLADGEEQLTLKVSAKPQKAAKKIVDFKAGKWNLNTELLTKE